jgi:hypothetical protein
MHEFQILSSIGVSRVLRLKCTGSQDLEAARPQSDLCDPSSYQKGSSFFGRSIVQELHLIQIKRHPADTISRSCINGVGQGRCKGWHSWLTHAFYGWAAIG